jgi:ribosomal protein S18 acetylase RimI-like enzyme
LYLEQTMNLRELVDADLPALLSLCQVALPYDTFTLPLLRRRIFADPEPNERYRISAWDGGQLLGAAVGVRRSGDERTAGGILLLAVAPTARRQGVATRMLDELEGRMRADGLAGIVAGGTAPNFFWAGVDLRYTPAYCLLHARGYATGDQRVNQLVDLSARSWDTGADEARLAAEGFQIRRLAEGDRAAFDSYMRAGWGDGWRAEALTALGNDPVTGFAALQGERFCGFAVYDSEGFAGHFGPTGTDEVLRGKGIGRILFYRCMADMRARGMATAEVVWVGPIPFYTRIADAYIHRSFWAMQKALA